MLRKARKQDQRSGIQVINREPTVDEACLFIGPELERFLTIIGLRSWPRKDLRIIGASTPRLRRLRAAGLIERVWVGGLRWRWRRTEKATDWLRVLNKETDRLASLPPVIRTAVDQPWTPPEELVSLLGALHEKEPTTVYELTLAAGDAYVDERLRVLQGMGLVFCREGNWVRSVLGSRTHEEWTANRDGGSNAG